MNIDTILEKFKVNDVRYLLIGGVNFLLRHHALLTYDIDLWIENTDENLLRCEKTLADLNAEWGATDKNWGPVEEKDHGWLKTQSIFCLTSPYGAIDIFLHVKGLDSWQVCRERSIKNKTASGIEYVGICDQDLLKSQEALDKKDQKEERMSFLRRSMKAK